MPWLTMVIFYNVTDNIEKKQSTKVIKVNKNPYFSNFFKSVSLIVSNHSLNMKKNKLKTKPYNAIILLINRKGATPKKR